MYRLLFLLLFHRVETQTCNISVPIGSWLENNTKPCAEVIGHFVLDQTANQFTRRLFSTFSNLTRIEGCIKVEGFTGANNLSFFSKLEDVICDKKKAREWNLEDVIYVSGPTLDKMGFNSLKTVKGPGDIFLSFEEGGKGDQVAYIQGAKAIDGQKCFSRQEMIFLAYQRKFKSKMYHPCVENDPCFRLDHVKRWYQLSDIPKNCTTFVGLICAVGPFEEEIIRNRFQNLTLLIGQLQIMGTLFDRLDFAFPKLENIYPYERPNVYRSLRTCNDDTGITRSKNGTVQYTHLTMNRFLTDVTLPSLRRIRPLDISIPDEIEGKIPFHFDPINYLPDTIAEPCSFFPEHECGYYRVFPIPLKPAETLENQLLSTEIYVVSIILCIIGMGFSYRALMMLMFSKVKKSLPCSRWLIVLVIFIISLSAVENCFIYQKIIHTRSFLNNPGFFFSEFRSRFLIYPLIQFLMQFLAASRHVCLVIVVVCYMDTIIFYRFESHKISKLLTIAAFIFACILYFFIYPLLFVAIRSRRPNYSQADEAVFMIFTLGADYLETFNRLVPDTLSLQYVNGLLILSQETNPDLFKLEKFPFDHLGRALPNYTAFCDLLMLAVISIFYILTATKIIILNHSFNVLVLLYLQLAANRIGYFIYIEILSSDFCMRLEYSKEALVSMLPLCYTDFVTYKKNIVVVGEYFYSPPFMDEIQWKLLEKLLERLPYIFYPIISFACYAFAKHYTLVGEIMHSRENKPGKQTEATKTAAKNTLMVPKPIRHA